MTIVIIIFSCWFGLILMGKYTGHIALFGKCKSNHCNSKDLIYSEYNDTIRSAWCKKCNKKLVGIQSDGGKGDWVYVETGEIEPDVELKINEWKLHKSRENKLKRIIHSHDK